MLNANGLRNVLRHSTQNEHDRLDALIGNFSDLASYRSFLVGSYRFRKSLEATTAAIDFWQAELLLDELAQDLEELGADSVRAPTAAVFANTPAEQLGLLYVLEGSALGGRLLVRRAEALGLSATHGARHLAMQVRDPGRWRRFLDLLESQEDIDLAMAVRGAQTCFSAALANFTEVHSEPAQFA